MFIDSHCKSPVQWKCSYRRVLCSWGFAKLRAGRNIVNYRFHRESVFTPFQRAGLTMSVIKAGLRHLSLFRHFEKQLFRFVFVLRSFGFSRAGFINITWCYQHLSRQCTPCLPFFQDEKSEKLNVTSFLHKKQLRRFVAVLYAADQLQKKTSTDFHFSYHYFKSNSFKITSRQARKFLLMLSVFICCVKILIMIKKQLVR